MQKKTKLQLADVLFVLTCVLGSAFSIYRFEKVLNESLIKHDTPIATITFKYKTAQRQFWNEVLWDRLKQNSEVYEGDLIRTSPGASATVFFISGNIMELHENTLVRLNLKKDGTNEVDIMNGNINVDSAEKEFVVKAGDSVLNIAGGSTLSAGTDGGKAFSIQVKNGSASYFGANGTVEISGGDGVNVDENGEVKAGSLSVIEPRMQERFLNFSEELYPVKFTWTSDLEDATIELSKTKDFAEIEQSYRIRGLKTTTILMPEGVRYWRLTVSSDNSDFSEMSIGRTEILQTHKPELVAPVTEYTTTYRTKKPTIRFIWKESEYATSYQLELSRDAAFRDSQIVKRTSGSSLFISNIEAGSWYWRVIPFYTVNNIGLKGESDTNSFVIKQSGELESPKLLIPNNGGIVNTKLPLKDGTSSYCKVNFSWKDSAEAQNYEILLSSNKNFSSPEIRETVIDNYFTADTSKVNIKNGKWYWKVISTDIEGNKASSDVREFVAIDANIEQRTLFPPDGYRLADSRSQDIRFVWKTNIPGETIFEISRDENFKSVITSQTTTSNSANGRYLVPNTYYWRIRSALDELNFETPAKRFIVESPMEAPVMAQPANGGVAIVRPKLPYELKWNKIEGADYYQIKIYYPSDTEKPVYERNFIEAKPDSYYVSYEMDFENFAETNYVITVQGFREETTLASRASSYLGKYSFRMVKIKPIELITPDDDISVSGVDAIKNPGTLKWNYIGVPAKSALVVYKDKIKPENVYLSIDNPERTTKLPRLYEGTYYWTVTGVTEDNYDISAVEHRRIKIGPIEKLPASEVIAPKNRATLDKGYFMQNRSIFFEWKPVFGADRYVIKLVDSKKNVIFEKTLDSRTTKFTFEKLDELSVGNFTFTVEAQTMFEGYVFQNGKEAKSAFKVSLPNIKKPVANANGVMYGK